MAETAGVVWWSWRRGRKAAMGVRDCARGLYVDGRLRRWSSFKRLCRPSIVKRRTVW